MVIDPLVTETSTFWQNHGESNDVDPSAIQTEVFRLPSTCFAGRRWLDRQLRSLAAMALERSGCPGEARNDGEILAGDLPSLCANCTAPKAGRARNPC